MNEANHHHEDRRQSIPLPMHEGDNEAVERPLHLVPTCVHLRHKLMYVDARHMTRGLVDDGSTTRQYWCRLSQDARGADGAGVEPRACASGRSCFRGRPTSALAQRGDSSSIT